ncbi:hypothetical protein H5410_014706 [Solanum commersonii]|uniref:Uncharacterized protein n=1 Tax=Solanum commersonii TaxID=4109 RepID=A0A9J5ZS66_SOLCO|nr:hypothetical protein H5410_014706 [Solanum commersonii]
MDHTIVRRGKKVWDARVTFGFTVHMECEGQKGDRLHVSNAYTLGMQHRRSTSNKSRLRLIYHRDGMRVRTSLLEARIQPNYTSQIPLMCPPRVSRNRSSRTLHPPESTVVSTPNAYRPVEINTLSGTRSPHYHRQHAMGDAARPRSTSTDRCVQDTDDVGKPLPMSVDRCLQAMDDASKPHPTSTDRCVQATDDADMPRSTSADQYGQAMSNVGRLACERHKQCWQPRPTSADRCMQATNDVGRPRPTSADRCVQATSNVD